MMAELDIEGNTVTALEVPISTNDDSSSVSHSRTSDDESISEPSSSNSDSDTIDLTSSLPLPLNLKPETPTEDVKVPHTSKLNRQNSLPPMLPTKAQVRVQLHVPKKDQGQGHRKQKEQQLQQHFLHGINVESCQNLLSIPDPPTPGKVNRRRQSSPGPMLQPLPFDDLTHSSKVNQQNNHADDSKVAQRSKSKSKRPRKSFSHVPSAPVTTDFDPISSSRGDGDDETGIRERGATETVTESSYESFTSLQVADDFVEKSDADASVTKRRKKRQSIALPSDTTTGTQEYFSTFMTYKKAPPTAQKEERTSAAVATALSVASMEQRPTAVNSQDLQELRKLVRSYTSLPLDSRDNCWELQDIRERTGYVLTPPLTCLDDILHGDPNLDDSDSSGANDHHEEQQQQQQDKQSLKASKMNLLVQMGPQLQYMDEKKTEQIQNSMSATDCFVEKKRGRYMYYDVSSNRTIPPDEYEQRYLLMLQDIHNIRSQEWAQHFQQVTVTDVVQEQALDLQSVIENESESGQESPLEMRDDVNDNYDDDDNDNAHEEMDICETSASFALGEDLDLEDDSNTSMSPCNNSNSSSKRGDEGQEIVLDEKGEFRALSYSTDGTVASPGSDYDNNSSVLPLPSREEESSDPEFAQAEQKLWGAIDHALEEYSRDILAIQTTRRMGVSSKVST
jgi:hypothetical protein